MSMRDLLADLRVIDRDHPLFTPAVHADVDRRAAAIREEMAAMGVPMTAETLRACAFGLMTAGRLLDVRPDPPTKAGHEIGMHLAAVAQLDGEVSADG